jgi:hypothetical protein
MIDAVDRELRERFTALVDRTDDSDWRALRGRPRVAVLAIAAALALSLAVAASAVGVPGRIVRLLDSAKPAPQGVERSFKDFDDVVGTDLVAPPREVLTTRTGLGETATLWVAPTTHSGYCSLIKIRFRDGTSEGGGGECGPRLDRLSVEVQLHGPFSKDGDVLGGPVLVDGFVGQEKASSLQLEFQDGQTASIPFVWMSEPVATGFFVYAVPRQHWLEGHRPTRLVVRTAGGHELAHADVYGFPRP